MGRDPRAAMPSAGYYPDCWIRIVRRSRGCTISALQSVYALLRQDARLGIHPDRYLERGRGSTRVRVNLFRSTRRLLLRRART